ncbi:MAG: DNA-directed RNA polymerase II core subunit [Piccolia ochrophora]|nr:MAG: DNA-directed RNA polymerase II core subunit [Piccolia ochrophora]
MSPSKHDKVAPPATGSGWGGVDDDTPISNTGVSSNGNGWVGVEPDATGPSNTTGGSTMASSWGGESRDDDHSDDTHADRQTTAADRDAFASSVDELIASAAAASMSPGSPRRRAASPFIHDSRREPRPVPDDDVPTANSPPPHQDQSISDWERHTFPATAYGFQTDDWHEENRRQDRRRGDRSGLSTNNLPNRFELFLLGDGEKKVTMEPDTRIPSSALFTFAKEDHTLANLLRSRLLTSAHVTFAGYRVPHPLFANFELRVQTDGSVTPKDALVQACRDIVADLATLGREFTKEMELKKMAGGQARAEE